MAALRNVLFILFSILILSQAQAAEPKPKADVQVEGESEKNETVQSKAFTESVLINALERGNSLVIAKILSVRANKKTKPGKFYFYKTKVIEPIIIGDLRESDIKEPVELFAGSSFGDALTPGSTYALFISKGAPYHLSWGFRNDVIKLDGFNDENLQALVEATTEVYKKTSIREFREAKLMEPAPYQILPEMPAIETLCELFRTNPQNRAEFAKKIYESDMGSRRDISEPFSSMMKYLPPKIILSREETASLLGEPTLKCGWTYKWFCGPDKNNPEHVGILSITFDQLAETSLVLYDKNNRVKWKQAEVKGPAVQVEGAREISEADKMASENFASEGWQLWRQRKLAEAEKMFKRAVEKDPANENAWNGLGWSQFNQGKPRNARVSFEKCLQINSKHSAALNGLGWIAKGEGKTEEAIGHWEKAVEAAPTATAALNGLATTYLELKRYDKAAKYYQMWLDVEPDNADAKAGLEKAKAQEQSMPKETVDSKPDERQVEQAVDAAEKWLKLVDDGDYGKSWDEAAGYFKKAVSKDQWQSSLAAVRVPLGKVISRKVKSKRYTKRLPGAPDGEYVVIEFDTSFENKSSAIETVTPMLDKDGLWRVSGYYIK